MPTNYKTVILPPATMAHFYSPSTKFNSTHFRKSHHTVWTKNNIWFPRQTSSSAGLTQDLLYHGKRGWSLLILLLGPEQQWRHKLSPELWNCPAEPGAQDRASIQAHAPAPRLLYTSGSTGSKGLTSVTVPFNVLVNFSTGAGLEGIQNSLPLALGCFVFLFYAPAIQTTLS